jgi:hypothetical protein
MKVPRPVVENDRNVELVDCAMLNGAGASPGKYKAKLRLLTSSTEIFVQTGVPSAGMVHPSTATPAAAALSA